MPTNDETSPAPLQPPIIHVDSLEKRIEDLEARVKQLEGRWVVKPATVVKSPWTNTTPRSSPRRSR